MYRRLGIVLFIGFWSFLLGVPSLREQVRRDLPPALAFLPDDAARQEQYANDVDVQVDKTRALPPSQGAAAHALELLVQAHPQDLWIRVLYLESQASWLPNNRPLGPLSNPNYPAPPPPRDKSVRIPVRQWEQLIKAAREGSRLDPNNAYFDTMTLYGLLALGRDEAALRVLTQAAKKTNYQNFRGEILQHHITALEKRHGALASGAKVQAIWTDFDFSSNGRRRQMGRWVAENALAERQKQHSLRSLEWSAGLMRLHRLARLHSYTIMDSLVADAISHLSLLSQRRPTRTGLRVGTTSPAAYGANPASAAFLARKNGDVALAREFETEWGALGAWSRGISRWISVPLYAGKNFAPYLTPTILTPLFILERLRVFALWPLPLMLLLWLSSFVLTREPAQTTPLTTDSAATPLSVSAPRWGFALGMFFVVLLTLGDLISRYAIIAVELSLTPTLAIAVTNLPNTLWYAGIMEGGITKQFPLWAWGVPAMGIIVLSLWLLLATQRTPRPKPVWRGDEVMPLDWVPFASLLLRVSLWLVGVAAYFALLVVPTLQEWAPETTGTIGFWLVLLGFPSAVLAYTLTLARRPQAALLWRAWGETLRGAASGALVALTLCYALPFALSQPLQARFDRGYAQYAQRGELAVARQFAKF